MKTLLKSRLLGAILLISGTTIGVGMLAFPTVTAFGGFVPSTFLFVAIWLLMLVSAFFFLDANLSVKEGSNMISMAQERLGPWGKLVAWVTYLLLLYALTAAYIAGCTPLIVEAIASATGYTLPPAAAPFALPVLFGGFVYFGTRGVDRINRLLMAGLVIAYLLLIFFLPTQIDTANFLHVDVPAMLIAIPVVITSFGYHILIPSLTTYMNRDRKALRKAIVIGSIIPIFVYLLWQTLVLGTVPQAMLIEAFFKGVQATEPLAAVLHNPWISLAAKLFAFFAIVTSFIGVTLSLSDFLTDGFKIKKSQSGRLIAVLLTFIPPLFFVFTYPRGFYLALQYAGAFVAILLVFLPAAMVWNLKKYKTAPRRFLLLIVMALAAVVVILDVFDERGLFKSITDRYHPPSVEQASEDV